MIKNDYIQLAISGLLVLIIGLSTGYSIGYIQAQKLEFPYIRTVEDINMGMPTLKLLEVKNGSIHGEVSGKSVRLAYNTDDIQDIVPGEFFEIPLNSINLSAYYGPENTPEGVHFIASKQGKYYYSILNPKAFQISPQNRYFFTNENDALRAGYKPYN